MTIWDLFSLNERQVARELKETYGSLNISKINRKQRIFQENNGFWIPNKPTTLTCNISFESLVSEQHKPGYNLKMKFCDLSLLLWEQVSFCEGKMFGFFVSVCLFVCLGFFFFFDKVQKVYSGVVKFYASKLCSTSKSLLENIHSRILDVWICDDHKRTMNMP